ncbi:hypothetical protein F5J12DRAFT_891682 [Pisolithus orientalis]|uniref:uncharacterized protein n=1 Tax=Pisolithus orientalis TaxID=936130 RepID=UPI00222599AE|nr:uncharacterized protein F5J12DRAFT_891682 [Pisolithus orientalis]KAI6009571.1 hypothetical protein F5J12DRAFT_891682 [Pisolithus orientalis]
MFSVRCVGIHRSAGYELRHHPKLQCRTAGTSRSSNKSVPIVDNDSNEEIALSLLPLDDSAEKTIAARHSILALPPLPSNIPADELQPNVLPHSYSLGDFLRNTTGVRVICLTDLPVKISKYLCGYPTFLSNPLSSQNLQTKELPHLDTSHDCATDSRVVNAHRWSAADVLGHMREPTEVLLSQRREVLELLSTEVQEMIRNFSLFTWMSQTTQAIIKETLARRKNVSPQNTSTSSESKSDSSWYRSTNTHLLTDDRIDFLLNAEFYGNPCGAIVDVADGHGFGGDQGGDHAVLGVEICLGSDKFNHSILYFSTTAIAASLGLSGNSNLASMAAIRQCLWMASDPTFGMAMELSEN